MHICYTTKQIYRQRGYTGKGFDEMEPDASKSTRISDWSSCVLHLASRHGLQACRSRRDCPLAPERLHCPRRASWEAPLARCDTSRGAAAPPSTPAPSVSLSLSLRPRTFTQRHDEELSWLCIGAPHSHWSSAEESEPRPGGGKGLKLTSVQSGITSWRFTRSQRPE